MIDTDNNGQYGGCALRKITLRGNLFDVNDKISPEQFQSVPHKNIRALVNTQQISLFEKPKPSDIPEIIEGINEVLSGSVELVPNDEPPVVVETPNVEVTAKRISDDAIAVGDPVEFRFEGVNVRTTILEISDDKERAVVKDAKGRIEVALVNCTKI